MAHFTHNDDSTKDRALCTKCLENLCKEIRDNKNFANFWHRRYTPAGTILSDTCDGYHPERDDIKE